ncbi:MAG: energy-coupling factor ABC transporter ATP-binding protein [Ancrocorticia sp.]|uniref:energy-coupling factor ABC transporter ATP-binding protein n=1 Tax=Ancrocorticia sp. TaxID=2593684 RepID=UPI003F9379D3
MIELDGVRVEVADYAAGARGPAKVLLDRLNLTLAEQRIALVGSNGSGKSTLLKLLNGLILPSDGTVSVAGLDTRKHGKAVRQRVGYVFTDPLAQLVMSTPLDDVQLSLRPLIKNKGERREKARDLLAQRGLLHTADQSIYDLSGGERQLVSLTTVLAVEPDIIVADEPTTLLDLRNRYLLRRVFSELPHQIIVSTHDLDVAGDMDRVIWLEGGAVVEDGVPSNVLAHYRDAMALR